MRSNPLTLFAAPGRALPSGRARSFGPVALLALAGLLLAGVPGCGDEAPDPDVPDRAERPAPDFELVPAPEPAPEFPDARLGIALPEEGERFSEGEMVEVHLTLSGYELGVATPGGAERGLARAADGQHVHLVLNDERYRAVYDLDEPVRLTGLPPGDHLLRAFPGTDWHEAVKTPGTFAVRNFHVGEGERRPLVEPDEPLLTYSRPVGEYTGADADSILVDFYLSGVRLSPEGYRVRLFVDGMGETLITSWAPHILVGLPAGEHTIGLELLDPEGVPVPGEFNRTERTISVAPGGREE